MPDAAPTHALSFCIPMDDAGPEVPVPRQRLGATAIVRPSACRAASTSRTPSSSSTMSRCRATACSSTATSPSTTRVMTTSWSPNIMQQTMIRAQTKLDFAWGLAHAHGRDDQRHRSRRPSRCWARSGPSPNSRARPSSPPRPRRANMATASGLRDVRPLHALRASLPLWFPRVNEIIRLTRLAQSADHADRRRRWPIPTCGR